MSYHAIFNRLGLGDEELTAGDMAVRTPIDGAVIANVARTPLDDLSAVIDNATKASNAWRVIPAPQRGELVRLLGEELRKAKHDLGELVSLECGKIIQEGYGEVQEMIDICDFAVGLSRQLYGLTIASERPGHHMRETWHPLGVCGVITAFNFPVAVWSWNTALALICGNAVIWKPSEKTPLTALACRNILQRALDRFDAPVDNVLQVIIGERDLGEAFVDDSRIALISATGSTAMGRQVAPRVAARFGRCILELGGNNAMVVTSSADLELAVRAIVFSAVGTAGQRCTSLRRLIVHEDVYAQLLAKLIPAYASVKVGDPLDEAHLVGPLIDQDAFDRMQNALQSATQAGATVHGGQRQLADRYPNAWYVQPAIVEMPEQSTLVQTETFAPILYAMKYKEFDTAIALHNDVPQGLSSCIFTTDVREAERFCSDTGSDCGIVNVNIGPSGAEIGGAFGGEKETGGGRESGSDAWKGYMRRATNTINYSTELPLAQGLKFEI